MHPEAATLWRGPRWALAMLLAALGTVGPFSIDTYLPAFAGIAADVGATPVQMQQTLSADLFGFAFMNLFHGALADSFGRRPVVLVGTGVFALASVGCALSTHAGWHAIFWFLAVVGIALWFATWRWLPESLHPSQAQPFRARDLMRGYLQLGSTSSRACSCIGASGSWWPRPG